MEYVVSLLVVRDIVGGVVCKVSKSAETKVCDSCPEPVVSMLDTTVTEGK